MFLYQIKRSVALGAKYGLTAFSKLNDPTVETPKMGESAAFAGAIGIVVTIAAVIIALYITAIVVGSMSTTITGGSINMSQNWKNATNALDAQAQSSFTLMGILPIAIVGVGILGIIISAFAMQ
jgi:hypothetical protein